MITRRGALAALASALAAWPLASLGQRVGRVVHVGVLSWYREGEEDLTRALQQLGYIDGLTAVIDPYGRVLATIPRHRAMALAGNFSFLAEETFYKARGDVFAWLCAVASGVVVGFIAFGHKLGGRR